MLNGFQPLTIITKRSILDVGSASESDINPTPVDHLRPMYAIKNLLICNKYAFLKPSTDLVIP